MAPAPARELNGRVVGFMTPLAWWEVVGLVWREDGGSDGVVKASGFIKAAEFPYLWSCGLFEAILGSGSTRVLPEIGIGRSGRPTVHFAVPDTNVAWDPCAPCYAHCMLDCTAHRG